jgi:hypothetical protein
MFRIFQILYSFDVFKLSTLPSKIAFSKVHVESPKGRTINIPRRELFDIRLQLMAEDEPEAENLISNLNKSDLRTNVYEGGFKSWECSFDLARLLLDRGPRKDLDDLCRVDHVIEVSAIPEFICSMNGIMINLTHKTFPDGLRHSPPNSNPLPLRRHRIPSPPLHAHGLQFPSSSSRHTAQPHSHLGKHPPRDFCSLHQHLAKPAALLLLRRSRYHSRPNSRFP